MSPLRFAILLAAWTATASGSLRVGAVRIDITPPADVAAPPPGNYAHERLFLRAIVLDNGSARAALIAADQGGFSEPIWSAATKQIAAELNCPVANIILSATHSHSAWGAGPRPGPGGPPADANQPPPPIVGQIVEAVRQAKAKLQPARAGFGKGAAYLNVNRDTIDSETHLWTQAPNLKAASDKAVTVLKFETPQGQPIAIYFTYAMHPVNGYLAGFTSADYPGAACRHIEQAYDDQAVAIFSQSFSGDQNPLYLRAATNAMASRSGVKITGNVLSREKIEAPLREGKVKERALDPKVADTLKRVMESEGVLLGEEVIRVMTNTTRLDANPRLDATQRTITCPGRRRTDSHREGAPGTYVDGDPVEIRLGLLRVGDSAVASVNAEIYSAIGLRLRELSPLANLMLVSIANGRANSGYVPDDLSFGAYSFQVLGSRLKPGCAEDAMIGAYLDLLQSSGQ